MITGLENLKITELHLLGNNIKQISGLNFLPNLRTIDLCKNNIRK